MSVIRHKTWHDIREHKGRTLQVVLIIAIGAFSIGTTMGALEYIGQDIAKVWAGSTPPMIGMWVDPPVDDAMIESLKGIEGVDVLAGRMEQGIRWRHNPDDPWSSSEIHALKDYKQQDLSIITLDDGQWPRRKVVAVERGHDLKMGDVIYLEIEDKEYKVEIGGVLYNTLVAPPSFGGNPTFYVTRERFTELTEQDGFDRIYARIPEYETEEAVRVADEIQVHLEKQNYKVGEALPSDGRTVSPDEHFIQESLDGVFFLLTSLAVVSLVLGLFLVYNTISAIIGQQVSQIGMMKAVGASFWQVLKIYYRQVFAYALLALLLAIPMGIAGAQGVRIFMVTLFNMEPGPVTFLPRVILVQTAIAVLSPLLVAVIPVFFGARITVREAISTYGLGGATGLVDRLLLKARAIPRTVALTIGNTFRNKGRVFFTQLTLVGSGLVFMMVMNTQASLFYTYSDVVFATFDANVFLNLEDNERIDVVEKIALAHPEVKAVELWGFAGGKLRPTDQAESNDDLAVNVRGLPVPTQTYVPQMRVGRWLEPGDTYTVVLNQEVAEKIGVAVGDWVTLNIPGKRESQWQVVGLLFEVFNETAIHVPRQTLLKETRQVGRASSIRIQTLNKDAVSEKAVAADLHQFYEANDLKVSLRNWETSHELTENVLSGGITIVMDLLAAMAVVIAIVGGVALSGVISLNVFERRREIGVMRAIGASSFQIFRLFVGEGLLLAWLSWLIALPLSIPAGLLLTIGLSSIMGGELSYDYSPIGMLYWLGIVTVLAIIASILPARGATRVSVQESLAYQ